jgi:hypothetical protein
MPEIAATRSQHSEPDRQSLGPAEKHRRQAAGYAGNFDPRDAGKQFLEQNPHLEAREVLTQTGVRAVAKGHIPAPVGVNAKTLGLLESLLVAVAG